MTEESKSDTTATEERTQDADTKVSTADIASGNRGGTADVAATSNAIERETVSQGDSSNTPLFAKDEAQTFRDRWTDIQTGFVDDPRQAVQQADDLVAETMKRLAEIFANERSTLEKQWSSGKDVSTEDLRVAMRRYRSFFDRLLSV